MTGIVDWAKLRDTARFYTHRSELSKPEFWDKEAAAYSQSCRHMEDLTQKQLNRLQLPIECTVLEVGAGTGRITIPLAKRVKQVTALDPSANMLLHLEAAAQKENLCNIGCLKGALEDLQTNEVARHDFVVASFSLVMADLEKSLLKMDALAGRGVYLFMSASPWMDREIQYAVYGAETAPGQLSDFICAYNILYDAGILANADLWDFQVTQCFGSLDEATESFAKRHIIPADKTVQLRDFLSSTLVLDEQNKLWWKRQKKAAMIWWIKNI
ncbi:MAG: methyltransferase domain-containing protein [Candidatus Bathyarchaeota archaeon]|nr:methyltransferase domain-containing protein [Candidatus Bathyarchaeota archaeon]